MMSFMDNPKVHLVLLLTYCNKICKSPPIYLRAIFDSLLVVGDEDHNDSADDQDDHEGAHHS